MAFIQKNIKWIGFTALLATVALLLGLRWANFSAEQGSLKEMGVFRATLLSHSAQDSRHEEENNRLTTLLNTVSAQYEHAQQAHLAESTTLKQDLSLANEQIVIKNNELQRSAHTIQALTVQNRDLESERDRMTLALARSESFLEQTNAELLHSEETLETFRGEKARLGLEMVRLEQERAVLQQEVVSLYSAIENADIKNTSLQTANRQLEQQQSQLEQSLAASQSELDHQLAQNQALSYEKQDLETAISDLKNEVTTLNRQSNILMDSYNATQNQLVSEQQRSENYSEQVTLLEEQLRREKNAINELKQSLTLTQEKNNELLSANQHLSLDVQQVINEKSLLVEQYESGITIIRLSNQILFDSGSAQLNSSGEEALSLVAETLTAFPDHLISVEGHTDHYKINGSLQQRYPSNWELSSARAASAIRWLVNRGVPPSQLQLVGYSDTRPMVEKENTEDVHQNRRIEILLYPPIDRKLELLSGIQ